MEGQDFRSYKLKTHVGLELDCIYHKHIRMFMVFKACKIQANVGSDNKIRVYI